MRSIDSARMARGLLALSALVLVPLEASSLELFEGNLGYEHEWLHVIDAPAMGDRVYWYGLGDDVTYHVQFATDATFEVLVRNMDGITNNYVTPDLVAGFYFFRVREIHDSGMGGEWSETGTLEVVEDSDPPEAEILSPVDGQTFSSGDTVPIEIRVRDDTIPHLARFTIGGNYAGTLGLKTVGYKDAPSFGDWRTVVFEYSLPSSGKSGALEIKVDITDVTYKMVTVMSGMETSKSSTGKTEKARRGRKQK